MEHPHMGIQEKKGLTFSAVIFKKRLQIVILLSITVITLLTAIGVAVGLQQYLQENTQKYVNDISKSMTENLHDIFDLKQADILTVADSIEQVNIEKYSEIKEFQERKAELLDFDMLILLDQNRKYMITAGDEALLDIGLKGIAQIEGIQKSFQGETQISYLGGQNLYYSCPVEQDDKITGVLIGIRGKEKMQQIIESKSLDSECISFILDSEGKMLLGPADEIEFEQIEMIFDQNMELVKEEIDRIAAVASGEIERDLHSVSGGGRQYYLTYNSLGINDWMLATVIPEDVVSGETNKYTRFFFFLILGISIAFVIFWMILRWSNEANRRSLIQQGFTDNVTGGANKAAFLMNYRNISSKKQMRGWGTLRKEGAPRWLCISI